MENVSIKAKYFRDGFRWKEIKSGTALNKNGKLRFEVQTNGLRDYEIWWQVTNTGEEAERANALRGDFIVQNWLKVKKSEKKVLFT